MRTSDPLSLFSLMDTIAFALLLMVLSPSDGLSQSRTSPRYSRDSLLSAARDLMNAQHYCALVTVDSSGQPHTRTMNPFPPEKDMTVWMATNSRSRKAAEIRRDPRVCLYYADHTKATGMVALYGKAVLVDEMSEKLKRKRAYWDQAFPDWKYLLLVKVVPRRVEVLNYSRGVVNDSLTWEIPSVDLPTP